MLNTSLLGNHCYTIQDISTPFLEKIRLLKSTDLIRAGLVITLLLVTFFTFAKISRVRPNIILIAMPKSASTYITTLLARGLHYRMGNIKKLNNNDYMKTFNIQDGKIVRVHIYPTTENLQILRNYTRRKIVLHIRDLRSSILSGVHHHTKAARQILSSSRAELTDYSDAAYQHFNWYNNLSLSEKIDYYIEVKLPRRVQWLKEWVAAKEIEDKKRDGLKIIITSYDELLADEQSLIFKISDHFRISAADFHYTPVIKDAKVNYRSGDPNEWRKVFSAEQIERANSKIPKELLQRFNWER